MLRKTISTAITTTDAAVAVTGTAIASSLKSKSTTSSSKKGRRGSSGGLYNIINNDSRGNNVFHTNTLSTITYSTNVLICNVILRLLRAAGVIFILYYSISMIILYRSKSHRIGNMWLYTGTSVQRNKGNTKIVLSPLHLLTIPEVIWFNDNNSSNSHMRRMTQHKSVHDTGSRRRIILCNVTTDVRGNLGPAIVLLNNNTDWIKDRWQAASDMHGTNIVGSHNVQLDWSSYDDNNNNLRQYNTTTLGSGIVRRYNSDNNIIDDEKIKAPRHEPQKVVFRRIVLDWEAAYSNNYDIQISTSNVSKSTSPTAEASLQQQQQQLEWVSIFTMRPVSLVRKGNRALGDEAKPQVTTTGGSVSISQWGQSPGVTFPTPLHILHDIQLFYPIHNNDENDNNSTSESSTDITLLSSSRLLSSASSKLRLVIHTSATGWGVSLWQIQIYGQYVFIQQ